MTPEEWRPTISDKGCGKPSCQLEFELWIWRKKKKKRVSSLPPKKYNKTYNQAEKKFKCLYRGYKLQGKTAHLVIFFFYL